MAFDSERCGFKKELKKINNDLHPKQLRNKSKKLNRKVRKWIRRLKKTSCRGSRCRRRSSKWRTKRFTRRYVLKVTRIRSEKFRKEYERLDRKNKKLLHRLEKLKEWKQRRILPENLKAKLNRLLKKQNEIENRLLDVETNISRHNRLYKRKVIGRRMQTRHTPRYRIPGRKPKATKKRKRIPGKTKLPESKVQSKKKKKKKKSKGTIKKVPAGK